MRYRIKEKLRSGELLVPGDQWPVFLYSDYNYDPKDPWNGLFRSSILVKVRLVSLTDAYLFIVMQAYKFVFTLPSSVEQESKATRSSNAWIHGMTHVTLGSIAYIATQVHFTIVLTISHSSNIGD